MILVHGASADHTTFRVIGPMLAATFTIHAVDRRGRGASGDGPAYAIEREFDDLAAVVDVIAAEAGVAVDVAGHSYGGRCALGAGLRTAAVRRIVSYEGAPTGPSASYHPAGVEDRIRERLEAGDGDEALATFLREVVGMSPADLAAYRTDPVWPLRAGAAGTVLREHEAETDPAASLPTLAGVRQPVLQVLGGESLPVFREATIALDEHLSDGRVVVIEGARHAAHHTHPTAFVAAITAFVA
jgi:pimeloyl-ACP methyl ester carboxylesterase